MNQHEHRQIVERHLKEGVTAFEGRVAFVILASSEDEGKSQVVKENESGDKNNGKRLDFET
jgi:hypothetical protein